MCALVVVFTWPAHNYRKIRNICLYIARPCHNDVHKVEYKLFDLIDICRGKMPWNSRESSFQVEILRLRTTQIVVHFSLVTVCRVQPMLYSDVNCIIALSSQAKANLGYNRNIKDIKATPDCWHSFSASRWICYCQSS